MVGSFGMLPDRQKILLAWLARICAIAAVAVGGFAFWKMSPDGALPAAAKIPAADFAPGAHVANESWSVFAPANRRGLSTNAADQTPRRFRLAGTFFVFGAGEVHKAILDDLQTKQQSIVGQGEQVAGYTVEEVGADRAVLVRGSEREVLILGLTSPAAPAAAAGTNVARNAASEKVLDETRFGKRVGDTRWIMNRRELLNYYQELLDNPDRIAAVYMSMKPEYKNDEIAGYRLNEEGERDFFKAVGLQEGDVIRKVNSMNMTSQARAEYFIGEFVKNRLNAVVIDIERDGTPQKMIYLTQ